ncbi:MAG: DUF423 domain-containing protein [Bacteroidetes bacterium]|nr:DUF423 domain-containing protein [Bacteroidota bacterium]
MQKIILLIASALGAVAVMLGAFGAHSFKSILEANGTLETFNTAVKYHFFHTLAMILVALLMDRYASKLLEYSAISMLAGIILFSGSLYILALSGVTKWGAVAPFGGLAFIIGWVMLFAGVYRNS